MKRIIIALAVLGAAMLSSCVQEKSFDVTPLGENAIAFVMQGADTRSAETVSDAVKGVTLNLGTTPEGEPLVLEETIEELNPSPATKGAPAYTKTVGKVHPTMGVYSPNTNFGDVPFEVLDQKLTYDHDKDNPDDGLGWRYSHNYPSSPWPADKTTEVEFYLRMLGDGTGVSGLQYNDDKTVSFTLTSTNRKTAESQEDLLLGYTHMSKEMHDKKLPNGYPVTMYHALSAVKFANGHENNNQTKTIITKVEFTGLKDNGTLTVNPATGAVTVVDGSAPVTEGFTFSQTFEDPKYTASAGASNWDGTVDYTNSQDSNYNPDLYGTSWTGKTEAEMGVSAASHNLNDKDGSLTFWFIPQTISNDVKLTVTFQIKTPDTPNGIDLKPITIDFGKLVNGVGTDNPKTVEWKAGQLRTYTLKPYEVDVDIIDSMSDDGKEKKQVRISNPGNVDEYVRVLIMGNWYGWKSEASKNAGDEPCILVGYKYKDKNDPNLPSGLTDAQKEEYLKKMVMPWYREGYPCTDPNDWMTCDDALDRDTHTIIDPYGHFDNSFTLASLGGKDGRDGKPEDWADASGGFYYTKKIGPGDLIQATQSATKDLFESYTLERTPTIYLPVGNSRQAAYGVHLVMEIVVQAIQVPTKTVMVDGKEVKKDIWWLEAWYEATKVAKLHPNAKKGSAYRNAIYRDHFIAGDYGDVVYDKYPVPEQ